MLIVFDLSRFRFHFSLSVACNFFKEKIIIKNATYQNCFNLALFLAENCRESRRENFRVTVDKISIHSKIISTKNFSSLELFKLQLEYVYVIEFPFGVNIFFSD